MPTAKKRRPISASSSEQPIEGRSTSPIDWSDALVTDGGGVARTIESIRRHRGPNRNPTKVQIAIRLDREIVSAFRDGGAGWQTRMNDALHEWLQSHGRKRIRTRARGA